MKNILSIETSTHVCSVSLFMNGVFLEAKESTKPRSHAAKLPLFVNNLLKNNDYNVSDLDGVAISIGPGSYTGLRIGICLAKGLALSNDLPLLPVDTLFAMDMKINDESPHWVFINSHKNMVFAQKFHNHEAVSEPLCISVDDFDDSPIYGTKVEPYKLRNLFTEILPSSKSVGEFALKNFTRLAEKDLEKISPFYLTEYKVS